MTIHLHLHHHNNKQSKQQQHRHNNHTEQENLKDKWYSQYFPIPFSSALHQQLEKLSLNPPIGCVETTLSEQYYFQRINDRNFRGHHNLVLAADIVPNRKKKNVVGSSHQQSINESSSSLELVEEIEIAKSEGEKLEEKCRKCIDILKYRHPLLCAVPTLKDKLKKKISSKISHSTTTTLENNSDNSSSHSTTTDADNHHIEKILHEIWTKEIVLIRGAIQFEIVEQLSVDIQILLDESSINPDNLPIENEEDLVKLLINHEITHSWDILGDPNRVTALWKLTLMKSKHTDGKWVCCFTFFHAICDATSIKIFLEEFASLFDYLYGETIDKNAELELEEVKRKALYNLHAMIPPSPIQLLENLKSKTTTATTRGFKKKIHSSSISSDQSPTDSNNSSSNASASSGLSTTATPTNTNTTVTAASTSSNANQIQHQHHHSDSDIPKKLGKLGGLLFYSRFVSQVVSYNGLSPIISFPLKIPFPEPAQTKVLIRHVDKLKLNKLIEKAKAHDLTITAIIQSLGCLAWALSSRSFNEKAREKTKFGFTNTITVDFREGILPPLNIKSNSTGMFRNYSSAILSTTKINLPHEFSLDNVSDNEKLVDIILDASYQTRNCLNKKYHDSLSTYQIVHRFLKYDISKKESFQMVFSNIGKLENLTGRNVRFELISAAYSSIGNTNGISNIFYTNSRTGELVFSICYPNSVHLEHVEEYLETMIRCLEIFVNTHSPPPPPSLPLQQPSTPILLSSPSR